MVSQKNQSCKLTSCCRISPIHANWQWNRMQGIFFFFATRHVSLFSIKFSWNTKLLWLPFQSCYTKSCCTHANISLTVRGRRNGHHRKQNKHGSCVFPCDAKGHKKWPLDPTPSIFFHLRNIEIYRESRFEEYTEKQLKTQKEESNNSTACVCD